MKREKTLKVGDRKALRLDLPAIRSRVEAGKGQEPKTLVLAGTLIEVAQYPDKSKTAGITIPAVVKYVLIVDKEALLKAIDWS